MTEKNEVCETYRQLFEEEIKVKEKWSVRTTSRLRRRVRAFGKADQSIKRVRTFDKAKEAK